MGRIIGSYNGNVTSLNGTEKTQEKSGYVRRAIRFLKESFEKDHPGAKVTVNISLDYPHQDIAKEKQYPDKIASVSSIDIPALIRMCERYSYLAGEKKASSVFAEYLPEDGQLSDLSLEGRNFLRKRISKEIEIIKTLCKGAYENGKQ